ETSLKNKSNLDAQLSNLANMNLALSRDAQNLAEALKGGKKAQGNWGECQLSRILEISGLRKNQDYETQESFTTEERKLYRPDVIIHLPENRDIVVDSKVSLTDYLDAVNTDDEETRQKALQKNVQAIKAHIDELSAKEYQKLLKERTLNYVIMFIPVESAYIAALDCDRYIYDYAYKKNIILATPLSLLPTLRTIENLWRIDSQNQNVEKIAELGGKIYDKLAAFVDDMKMLERGINQANNAYNNAMIKLTGRGGAVSQAEKMKTLGAKTGKNINLALNDNNLILEPETELLTTSTSGE
ncbi:MAG: DNA recombination protein RmuC, partial [Alphaproteobacteria bacterium]|nr:DNA recombination protein RmuC [Alphaproteobacteria bacterium]